MSPSTEPIQSGSSTDPAIANTRVHDVFQSIVKGRKSWKTLKGGEVVWPPELEAALIEGLENYQPDDSRETRLLGRFPMRNRFISDWIFEKTGKKRTAKQVGSRLQQLRDTCGGKRLLNLLSPNRRFPRRPSLSPHCPSRDIPSYGAPTLPYDSESCSDSSGSPPSTPTNEAHSTLQKLLYRGVEPRSEELPNTIVYIDVLPTGLSSSSPSTSRTPSEQAAEERSWTERGFQIVRPPQAPRRLVDIDPTITLASPNPIEATSHFTVLSDEGIVHSYSVQLEEVVSAAVPPPEMGTSLYKTRLVPEFWDTIVQCRDASRYVIIQRVVASPNSATPSTTLFEAMYKFNYTSLAASAAQPQVYSSSPTMLPIDVSHPKQHDYNNYGILPMDNHFASEIMYPPPGKAAPGGGGGAPANFFDFSYVQVPTEDDWGTASDTTGSVYASPIDTQKPIPFAMPGDEQLMSSPSSFHAGDISTYGL